MEGIEILVGLGFLMLAAILGVLIDIKIALKRNNRLLEYQNDLLKENQIQ